MLVAPAVPTSAADIPRSGTGVPCQVAQCDGVPCAEVQVDCEHCDRSTNRLCDEHRDATGDAAREPTRQPKSNHA
ncbi:MAG: hypothetical protein ACYC5V_10595 [Gemmatimonadaceae bacterium]